MLPLLKLYKSTIKKHNNTIKVDTSVEWAVYILLTLREMLETKPILVHFTTKNDTLLKTTNSINKNAIKLIKVNINN